MAIKEGDTVKIDYEGTLDDGKVFDSSKGRGPIEFEVGKHMVIKGFEQAVIGLEKGQEKTIHITPDEAYGQRNEKLVQDVPKTNIPIKEELKQGMILMLKSPDGHQVGACISKVTDKTVTLDLNHPLAGKNLNFKIKVVEISKAKK